MVTTRAPSPSCFQSLKCMRGTKYLCGYRVFGNMGRIRYTVEGIRIHGEIEIQGLKQRTILEFAERKNDNVGEHYENGAGVGLDFCI